MRSVCVCGGDQDEVGLRVRRDQDEVGRFWPADESVDELMVSRLIVSPSNDGPRGRAQRSLGNSMREINVKHIVLATLAMLVGSVAPAFAGAAYEAPKLTAGKVVEAPAELIETAKALLEAARGGDTEKMAPFFAPSVTVISAGLDLDRPRAKDKVTGKPGTDAIISALGQHTGGDWDVPKDADIGLFLAKMERDFIVNALTDGNPWGSDPLVKGAICTYPTPSYAAKAVKAAAKALSVETSSFFFVNKDVPTYAAADAKGAATATLSPGLLHAMDYDTQSPKGWLTVHLPAGGTGFVVTKGLDSDKPYMQGLCFGKTKTGWQVVAQTSTGV
jgi:hypothetical protein